MQAVTDVQQAQLLCGGTDLLKDNHNSTLLAVIGGDSKRDSFAFLVHTQDNKLPGQCFLGNMWGMDNHLFCVCIECLFFKNFVHSNPPP